MKRHVLGGLLVWLGAAAACGGETGKTGRAQSEDNPSGVAGSADRGATASSGAGGKHSSDTGGKENASEAGQGGTSLTETEGPSRVPLPEPCFGAPVQEAEDDFSPCEELRLHEVERLPANLVLILDRSGRMTQSVAADGTTRWQGLRKGIAEFIDDPEVQALQLRVSLQFFGQAGDADAEVDCSAESYAKPDVPMGDIQDSGGEILASIDETTFGTERPTLPAIEGALSYAEGVAREDPGADTAVLLITAGLPTACQNPVRVDEIAQSTEQAHSGPASIRTYVVGLGPGLGVLSQIAQAGGSDAAFLINDGSIAKELTLALKEVVWPTLSCRMDIAYPPSRVTIPEILDAEIRIWQPFVSDEGTPQIPAVTDSSACSSSPHGGWYPEYSEDLLEFVLCPCSCSAVRSGALRIEFGCRTLL